MVKRVASAIFLLIFAAATAGRIFERTEAWAAQHTYSKHLASNNSGQPLAETHKHQQRERQSKLLEDGSVLHVSFVSSANAFIYSDVLLHQLTRLIADSNERSLSSRAPPILL